MSLSNMIQSQHCGKLTGRTWVQIIDPVVNVNVMLADVPGTPVNEAVIFEIPFGNVVIVKLTFKLGLSETAVKLPSQPDWLFAGRVKVYLIICP